jgi:uncharacterized tellurite resistance protein B-like protein
MELIILIVIGFIIYLIYQANNDNSSGAVNNSPVRKTPSSRKIDGYKIYSVRGEKYSGASVLSVSFSLESKTFGETKFNGIMVNISGSINGLVYQSCSLRLIIRDDELENHELGGRLLTEVDALSKHKDGTFLLEKSIGKIPYYSTSVNNLEFFIPLDFVTFPKAGRRTYKIHLVLDANGSAVGLTEAKVDIESDKDGYIDVVEKKESAQNVLLKLAFKIAISDGHIDLKEKRIIKRWVSEKDKPSLTSSYEEYVNSPNKLSFESLENLLDQFKLNASPKLIEEGLDLLMEIISADSSHEESEREIINLFIEKNKMTKEQYQKAYSKHLDTEIITTNLDSSDLGINENMSTTEKKRILREKYKYWVSRTTSTDPKVKANAEKMIEKIAQIRASLD